MTAINSQLSVLMATYGGDSADFLAEALQSLADQTVRASEVVLVEDGPLPSTLTTVITRYRPVINIRSLPLSQNMGLGIALQQGVEYCSTPIVARMDSDDIALPQRLAVQCDYLQKNPEIALIGSHIAEFDHTPSQALHIRKAPLTHKALRRAAWFRTPFNHMTVMFRKKSVLDAGNYKNVPHFEDYDLWLRMLASGVRCSNIDQVLVLARTGNGLIGRRSGKDYSRAENKAIYSFRRYGVIPAPALYLNLAIRYTLRQLPPYLLHYIYRQLRSRS